MKQRVIVQAIVRNGDATLLLRRSQGRPSTIGQYELPGGRLETEEQPDQSMRRHVQNDTGLNIVAIKLIDSVALSNPEEGNVQNVLLIYDVVASDPNQPIKVGTSYDDSIWQPLSQIQQLKLRDSTKLVLEIINKHPITDKKINNTTNKDVLKTSENNHVIIYSDGGSRGNPGPSSAGFVIMDENEVILDEGGEYLGITTNNIAEYQGVRIGLEHARSLGAKTIDFRLDSLLVVNQMKGIYKIKNRELWPVHERIKGLIAQFDKVNFIHVPRELNQIADSVVNSTLDKHKAAAV